MIKIRCFTNLDQFKRENWPRELPAVPQKGQWMQSESRKKLAIVNTTWCYDGVLEVELHTPW